MILLTFYSLCSQVTIIVVLSISLAEAINKPQLDLLAPFGSNEVQPKAQAVGRSSPQSPVAKSVYPDVSKLPLQNTNSFSQGRSAESKSTDAAAQILRSENVLNLDGSYQYLYETDNGLNVKEQGQPKEIEGSNDLAMQVQGGYEYTAPDGAVISMSYIANENGFQPTVSFYNQSKLLLITECEHLLNSIRKRLYYIEYFYVSI